MGAAYDVGFYLLLGDRVGIDVGGDFVDLFDVGQDFGAAGLPKDFAGDRPGCDPADRFPGAGTAAALPVPNAIFGLVGVVGVRGPVFGAHLLVVFGPDVFVPDEHGDGRAEGFSFKEAREDFHAVGFLPLGGDAALSGPPPVEFDLDFFCCDRKVGGTSVDDYAAASPVGFAPGGDAKQVSE